MTEAAARASIYDALYPHVLDRFLEQDKQSRSAGAWLIGSAVLFVLFSIDLDVMTLVVLMVVLLFHELGHLLAMWAFGYRDLKIFFLPLLGAVTSGKARGVAQWKQALVLLAGPVPGIIVAYPIAVAAAFRPETAWLDSLVFMLLFINGFNLLPFVPLDGGRLIALALFSRGPRLETWFSCVSAGGLVALALWLEAWLLAAIGGLLAMGALSRNQLVARAHVLRARLAGCSPEPEQIGEQERAELYAAAVDHHRALERRNAPQPAPEALAKQLASYMRILHERAVTQPAGTVATVVILLVYAGAFAAILPLAVLMLAAE